MSVSKRYISSNETIEATTLRKPRIRKEWDTYLTDGDRFKLTKDEIIKKKSARLGFKNNQHSKSRTTIPRKSDVSVSKSVLEKHTQQLRNRNTDITLDKFSSLDLLHSNNEMEITISASVRDDKAKNIKEHKKVASDVLSYKEGIPPPGKRRNSQRRHKSPLDQSFTEVVTEISSLDEADAFEVTEMAVEIKSMYAELQYYKQVAGLCSVFEDETEETMALDEVLNGCETQLYSNATRKTVARSLIQLVCRSMTYLLQSEIDKQALQARCDDALQQLAEINATSSFIGTSAVGSEHALSTPATFCPLLPTSGCSASDACLSSGTPRSPSASLLHANSPDRGVISSGADFLGPHSETYVSGDHLTFSESASTLQRTASERPSLTPSGSCAMTGTSATDWLFSTPVIDRSSPSAGSVPSHSTAVYSLRSNLFGSSPLAEPAASFSSMGRDAALSLKQHPSSREGQVMPVDELLAVQSQKSTPWTSPAHSSQPNQCPRHRGLSTEQTTPLPVYEAPDRRVGIHRTEQTSVSTPNVFVPVPHSAPQHPFRHTVTETQRTSSKESPGASDTAAYRTDSVVRNVALGLGGSSRSYDARNGSY